MMKIRKKESILYFNHLKLHLDSISCGVFIKDITSKPFFSFLTYK